MINTKKSGKQQLIENILDSWIGRLLGRITFLIFVPFFKKNFDEEQLNDKKI